MSDHPIPITTVLATLALFLMSACSNGAGMQPTMTIAEANKRVDQHIAEAIAQIPGKIELDERLRFEESDCSDPDDHGPQGRKIAEREYEIVGINPNKVTQYFDILEKWWQENGYTILDHEPKYIYLLASNNEDEVHLNLQSNDQNRLIIIASSPCVWPNGKPQPE